MVDRKMTKELNPAQKQALEAGRVAKREHKGFDAIPGAYRIVKSLALAWRKGWEEEGRAEIMTPAPRTVVREPDTRVPQYLEENAPLPETYVRPQPIACRLCRMIKRSDGTQAVVLLATSVDGRVAHFKCRGCKKDFKLPVEGKA